MPNGTTTEYEEGIDLDQTQLNGGLTGAGLADGGYQSIDPKKLIRDPYNGCKPVYPWNFVRTNTIFGVLHEAGRYVAWSDMHPAYSVVAGPGGATKPANIDDYYAPEINSNVIALPGVKTILGLDCSTIPDTTADQTAWTNSFTNIQCYDTLKVSAVVNWIYGRDHDNAHNAPVPAVFGMNFQAVSVGQKLVDKSKSPVLYGGYTDAQGTPTPVMKEEIQFVDASIARMINALDARGLRESTLIIITAKHGQSPSQIWLLPGCSTDDAVSQLQSNASQLAIDEIFYGHSLTTMFHKPGLPENGGFAFDDTNVIMLVSHPSISRAKYSTWVETTQVAPTIIKALGLDPNLLEAVRIEGTPVLPNLF